MIGCVFVGGKSSRMGQDKSRLDYHGVPQYKYVASLFGHLGAEVCLSASSPEEWMRGYNVVIDQTPGLGPLSGLHAVLTAFPDQAVLTCPCDTPLVDAQLLGRLLAERDKSKMATCFYNKDTDFPEPLITLWEAGSHRYLNEGIAAGFKCPRKVLIRGDVKLLDPGEQHYKLFNVNTPEQMVAAKAMIKREDRSA